MKPPPDPVRRRLLRLHVALLGRFGRQRWWPARTGFEVVVGAVLAQHTAWSGVERAIANLRAARALDAVRLTRLSPAALGRLVRPAGTYRVKARRLRALVGWLRRRFMGRIQGLARAPLDGLRRDLLAVPGVGPETADAILLYAGGRPVFVADAYSGRVLARHRLVPPAMAYEELRGFLERHLPRDPALFNELHALLVAVAKAYCRARPRCAGCPLRGDLGGRPPRG